MIEFECPYFELGTKLTPEQLSFFDKNGVIVFRNFINRDTVELFIKEINALQSSWILEGREKVNGTPLKFGKDENGNTIIQRMCFTSMHNAVLHEFLKDPRFKALPEMVSPYEGRISENEKDGLVINQYIKTPESTFSQMGWHTDSPRDIFLGQKIMPMLNVGIHLDDCPAENGGLRLLTGTHKQGILKMLFGKKYFVDNNADPQETGLNIHAGDLTVHDGRLWHRVQQSPYIGAKSRRRVMYIPVITGKVLYKNEKSKTPFYHHFIGKVKF